MDSKILKVNGKLIDLSLAAPLLVRDHRALRKLGVSFEDVRGNIEMQVALATYICQKCNKEIVEDDIDGLSEKQFSELSVSIADVIRDAPARTPLNVQNIETGMP